VCLIFELNALPDANKQLQRSYINYPAEGERPPVGRVVISEHIDKKKEEQKFADAQAAPDGDKALGRRRYWLFGPREKV
jgi:hypothetical protein